ncbi:MAG: FG-GAP-like repeat-containing protein, partial [Candidatus Jordarchaeales archaeon]
SDDFCVYAWHHDGSLVNGWPKQTGYYVVSSPALGDLDGDGDIEVVVGSGDGKVYAWHHDGSLVNGWPKKTGNSVDSSPALGDLDGDGDLEVVVGSNDRNVYAWHHDGSLVNGWPKQTGDIVWSSPALGDIDGDGNIEVVVGSDDFNVYVFDCPGENITITMPWPMFRHDTYHTGCYNYSNRPPPAMTLVITPLILFSFYLYNGLSIISLARSVRFALTVFAFFTIAVGAVYLYISREVNPESYKFFEDKK